MLDPQTNLQPDNYVPVPHKLPGEYSVLTYDPDSEAYTLYVDDGEHSSFDLGSDPLRIGVHLRRWFGEIDGERWFDGAREFRAAQIIHSDRRVLFLTPDEALPHLGQRMKDGHAKPSNYIHI